MEMGVVETVELASMVVSMGVATEEAWQEAVVMGTEMVEAALVEEAGKVRVVALDLQLAQREVGSGVVTVAEAPAVVTVASLEAATAAEATAVETVETRVEAGSSAPVRARLLSRGVAGKWLRFERCTKSRSPREAYRSREGRGPTNLQNRPVHLTRGTQVRLQPGARR